MPLFYEIDDDGFYVKDVFIQRGEAQPENTVSVQPPQPCVKPQWTGYEWVEQQPELLPTPEKRAEHELTAWRASTVVSAFQAHQALDDYGLIEQVEAEMAKPETTNKTRRAWEKATEFRRLSETVIELAAALALTDEQVDDLFRHALTIEA